MLYLVGTPIGNMDDMSPRGIEILSEADVIACEDTRRTGLLLQHFGIEGKLFSYHEHNKAAKGPVLVNMMKDGMDVALVSDAGMPSINDPGEDLVKLCIENDIDISVAPGPVAAITALVMSGLDTTKFHYEGFLPAQSKQRRERLEALKGYKETMILYEAPHRLIKLINELKEYGFGSCRAAFCREMTKKYEQVLRMTIDEAVLYYDEHEPKGEFVICLEASGEEEIGEEIDIDKMILDLHEQGMPTKKISQEVSGVTGISKKEIYERALHLIQ